MKKILYIIALSIAIFNVACSPLEDVNGVGEIVSSADQINSTITPIMVGSYKTNKVKVHCTSPVLCQWSGGPISYVSNDTTVLLFAKGNQTVKLTALAADGTKLTKSYSVTVDSMHYNVPAQWGYLCGTGSKTWVWAADITANWFPGAAAGKCYGNGGYLASNGPSWWTCGLSDLTGWGVANDEMTFDMNGAANFTLVTGNTQQSGGVNKGLQAGTYSGKFSFDMSKSTTTSSAPSATNSNTYSIGQLTLTGSTVSLGYQPNVSAFPSIYTYDILYLDNNVMVLEVPEPGVTSAWGTAWFWVFKRKGYTFN
jgi:hypothetical protein